MNYNHPYTKFAREFFVTVPIVPAVRGIVIDVPVQPNQLLRKGDVLFQIDPTPFKNEVDRLEALLADAEAGAAQLSMDPSWRRAANLPQRFRTLVSRSRPRQRRVLHTGTCRLQASPVDATAAAWPLRPTRSGPVFRRH